MDKQNFRIKTVSNQALSPVVPFYMAVRECVLCAHGPVRLLHCFFTNDPFGSAGFSNVTELLRRVLAPGLCEGGIGSEDEVAPAEGGGDLSLSTCPPG